jgi:hypothetical protein
MTRTVRENNSVSVTGRIAAIIVLVVVAFAMVNTACGKGGGGGNPVAPTTPAPVTPTPTPAEVTVSMAGLSAEGKEMIKMLLIPGTGATDDKNALDHVRRWADGQVISIYAPDFNPEHLVHAMTFWTEVSGGKLMFSVVTEESQAKVKLSRDPLPGNACAIASWSDMVDGQSSHLAMVGLIVWLSQGVGGRRELWSMRWATSLVLVATLHLSGMTSCLVV